MHKLLKHWHFTDFNGHLDYLISVAIWLPMQRRLLAKVSTHQLCAAARRRTPHSETCSQRLTSYIFRIATLSAKLCDIAWIIFIFTTSHAYMYVCMYVCCGACAFACDCNFINLTLRTLLRHNSRQSVLSQVRKQALTYISFRLPLAPFLHCILMPLVSACVCS